MTDTSNNDARKVEIAELSGIMGSASGRNVIRRILENSGYFGDTFNVDPYKHALNAGRRQVGIMIASELQDACPGEFQQLLREHYNG